MNGQNPTSKRHALVVLGGGGFIGSNFVEYVTNHGIDDFDITVVDVSVDKLAAIDPSAYRLVEADLSSAEALDACRGADTIVDLAAFANPSLYVTKPLEVVDLNFTKNLEVVELAVAHGKRLVQYSTCEVYGKVGGPAWSEDESDLVMGPIHQQRWIYAAAKQLLERIIYAYGAEDRLDFTIVRPFNFVGPRFDYLVPAGSVGGPRVFAHYLSALLDNGPMYLVDGGMVHRTFTHIDDASRGLLAILRNPAQASRQIINIGNPENTITVRAFGELMRRVYGELTGTSPTSEMVEMSSEDFYGPGYEDVDRFPPDVSKLEALGWSAQHSTESAVRDAIAAHLADSMPAS